MKRGEVVGEVDRVEPQRTAASERGLVTTLLPPGERLLGVADVAALLGVCRATIYAMCEDGTIEHFRVRNQIRIPQGAAQRYLDAARKGGRS